MAFTNEQKQAEKIRKSYEQKQQTKTAIEELKELDRKVKKPVKIFSYVYGTIGSLVLGTGMCLAMGVIGASMPLGIVIGIVGIGMVSSTYSIHNKILNSRKDKYRDQIFEKSDGLINEPTIAEYMTIQKQTQKHISQTFSQETGLNVNDDRER